ncbi:MAG: tetratricopeptide repeat protein [Nitrospirota bacterium]
MQSPFIPKRVILLALLIGACAALVYLPALNLGFVNYWDDDKYVYDNPHILTLTGSFFKWAFTTIEAGGNWHPLTWLSLGIDRYLWGTGPMGFHATNILLHSLNTVLVTILAALLIAAGKNTVPGVVEGRSISDRGMMITAAVTGILFGFHPIHVESVAWISERKDVLYAFFFLTGILAYMRYAWSRQNGIAAEPFYRGRSFRLYSLTLLLFVLSLLSKPMAVTFPAVLLILDWHPLRRFEPGERRSSVLLEKLPFFALSVAFSIVTMAGQTLQTLKKLPLMDRLLNGIHSLIMYLWNILIPLNLLPYYPYPSDISPLSRNYLPALLIAACIAASCFWLYKMKRGRTWIAAWGYYLVTLLPVLGFIQVGTQSMADRYAYLPSLGPFLLTGLGLALVVDNKSESPSESLTFRYSALIVLGILALSLSSLTVRQIGIWKDGITFWNYIIEKEPSRVEAAYINRGTIYLDRGQLEDALRDYNIALTINPELIVGYSNRAQVYIRLNKHTNAMNDLTTALTINPRYVLGYVYRSMMYNWYGDHDKALADLTAAVTIKPDFVSGYYHRGNTNLLIGQYDKAIADFSKALSLAPNSPEGYFYRGKAYRMSGRAKQAEQDFEAACKMGYREACRPEHPLDGRSQE